MTVEGVDATSDMKELSLADQLEKAEALKGEGNDIYRKGSMFKGHTFGKNAIVEACGKYAEALQILKRCEKDFANEVKTDDTFVALLTSVLLNIAQASLFLESPEAAINCCTEVIELDASNAKALYRRSKAHEMNSNLHAAEADLKQVALLERKKTYYEQLQALRTKLQKLRDKESYLKETEEAMRRLDFDKKDSCTKAEDSADLALSDEWLESCGVEAYCKNGSRNEAYVWGQTLQEVHLILRLPSGTRGVDVDCQFARTWLTLGVKTEKEARFDRKELSKPVTVHECTWEIECEGCLHIVLYKESPTGTPARGEEWWTSAFRGESEIDPSTACDVGDDLSALPEQQKREIEKSVWRDQQKTPEEKKADEELIKVKQEMIAMKKQREENNAKAMKNPKKKAIMEMMQQNFPDIPVEFK